MYMTFSFSRYSYCRERGLGQLAYPLTESALLPAPGGLSPFNSDCYSVHTQSTQIHRLMISWFGKRPWASSDASSNFYPIHKAPDRHSEFKSLLEYLQGQRLHWFLRNSLSVQQCKVLDIFSQVNLKPITFKLYLLVPFLLLESLKVK